MGLEVRRAALDLEWPPQKRSRSSYWPFREGEGWQMWNTTFVDDAFPMSPVCKSPESLARWLADNRASAFAGETARYEEWLHMIRGDGGTYSCAVEKDGSVVSGVTHMYQERKKERFGRRGLVRRARGLEKKGGRDGGERER